MCLIGCSNEQVEKVVEDTPVFNYSVSIKYDATEDQKKVVDDQLHKIYTYFEEHKIDIDPFEVIVAGFTRLELENNRLFINFEDYTSFDLIQGTLQNTYSEYLHYGLMYGLVDDILASDDFETEKIDSEVYLEEWSILYLTAMNFRSEIATSDEIKLAKSASVDFYAYIIETRGQDYFNELLKESTQLDKVYVVHDLMEEWILSIDSEFSYERFDIDVLFSQYYQDDRIKYITKHHDWELYFDKGEMSGAEYPGMHDSLDVFYDYLIMFYDEIERLQTVLDFESGDLQRAEILIYKDEATKFGGLYKKYADELWINSLSSFSHEYVHFLDIELDRQPVYSSYAEMKAVYYSKEFAINQIYDWLTVERVDGISEEAINELDWYIDPKKEVEDFTGRPFEISDFHGLYTDLIIKITLLDGQGFPKLYEVSVDDGYPTYHWNSIMGYIVRNYGDEAVESIMLHHQLPNGQHLDMTDLVEEWKVYISNFDESDYGSYYQ